MIQLESLTVIVCEIFSKIAFSTFDLGPRSEVMALNETPYMISYMSSILKESLSLIVCEIFANEAYFTFDQCQR